MRTLSRNALTAFSGDVAARALGFVATLFLTRSVGREGFGLITVGISFLSYALWFSDLGLSTLGAREMARPPEQRRYRARDFFTTRILLASIILPLATALAWLIYHSGDLFAVTAAYLLSLLPVAISLEWYFQGKQRFMPIAIARALAALVFLVGIWLVVESVNDILYVPWMFAAGFLAANLLLLAVRGRGDADDDVVVGHDSGDHNSRDNNSRDNNSGDHLPRFTLARGRALLREASSIGVGSILAQSVQLFPPLVLGWYSKEATGDLGAAIRIVFVLLTFDRVFGALFLPAIASLWSRDRERAVEGLGRVFRLVTLIGFTTATVVTIHATPLMNLIFGDAWHNGARALAILSWFVAATFVNSLFSFGLIALGNERGYLRSCLAGGVVAGVLSLLLIPYWGIDGAAIAMAVSELAMVLFAWREFRHTVHLSVARPLLVSAILSAGVICISLVLPIDALWLAPLNGVILLALALLLGVANREDINWALQR